MQRSGLQAELLFVDNEEENYSYDDIHTAFARVADSRLGTQGLDFFRPAAKEKLLALEPDLVLSDFYDPVIGEAADDLGLPKILHVPVPLQLICAIMQYTLPFKSGKYANASVCCGMICMKKSFRDFVISRIFKTNPHWVTFIPVFKKMRTRLMLSNTFIGFDQP